MVKGRASRAFWRLHPHPHPLPAPAHSRIRTRGKPTVLGDPQPLHSACRTRCILSRSPRSPAATRNILPSPLRAPTARSTKPKPKPNPRSKPSVGAGPGLTSGAEAHRLRRPAQTSARPFIIGPWTLHTRTVILAPPYNCIPPTPPFQPPRPLAAPSIAQRRRHQHTSH